MQITVQNILKMICTTWHHPRALQTYPRECTRWPGSGVSRCHHSQGQGWSGRLPPLRPVPHRLSWCAWSWHCCSYHHHHTARPCCCTLAAAQLKPHNYSYHKYTQRANSMNKFTASVRDRHNVYSISSWIYDLYSYSIVKPKMHLDFIHCSIFQSWNTTVILFCNFEKDVHCKDRKFKYFSRLPHHYKNLSERCIKKQKESQLTHVRSRLVKVWHQRHEFVCGWM